MSSLLWCGYVQKVEVGASRWKVGCRCEEDGVEREDGCRVFGCKRVPGYFFCVFVFGLW